MYCAGYPSSLPTQLNWCNEGQRQTEETVTCFQQDKLNEKASLEAKTNHHENMVFYTHHLLPTTWYDSLTCSGVYLKSTARVHPLGSLQRKHWKFGSEKYQSDLTRISFPHTIIYLPYTKGCWTWHVEEIVRSAEAKTGSG